MDVIDAPLLDYGFQPVVNRLMKHPIDVALVTATGGGVLLGGSCLSNVALSQPLTSTLSLLGVAVQGCALGTLYSRQHQWRGLIKPGMRNPLRYMLAGVRLPILLTTMLFVVILALPGFDAGTALFIGGLICWTFTYYFESCDHPPVKPQRTRHMAMPPLEIPV